LISIIFQNTKQAMHACLSFASNSSPSEKCSAHKEENKNETRNQHTKKPRCGELHHLRHWDKYRMQYLISFLTLNDVACLGTVNKSVHKTMGHCLNIKLCPLVVDSGVLQRLRRQKLHFLKRVQIFQFLEATPEDASVHNNFMLLLYYCFTQEATTMKNNE
jgi:hypothetical protein